MRYSSINEDDFAISVSLAGFYIAMVGSCSVFFIYLQTGPSTRAKVVLIRLANENVFLKFVSMLCETIQVTENLSCWNLNSYIFDTVPGVMIIDSLTVHKWIILFFCLFHIHLYVFDILQLRLSIVFFSFVLSYRRIVSYNNAGVHCRRRPTRRGQNLLTSKSVTRVFWATRYWIAWRSGLAVSHHSCPLTSTTQRSFPR